MRLSACGDLRIVLEERRVRPVELAGEPSAGLVGRQARQPLEGRVDLEDAIVDRAAVVVDELVQGDSLGHGLEERAKAAIALAQRCAELVSLGRFAPALRDRAVQGRGEGAVELVDRRRRGEDRPLEKAHFEAGAAAQLHRVGQSGHEKQAAAAVAEKVGQHLGIEGAGVEAPTLVFNQDLQVVAPKPESNLYLLA